MVFSTYPTMLNAIDQIEGEQHGKLFTVGHFDLIIIDESHRSIYQKYKSIFEYFDAKVVGLTATPRDDIDKNTYQFFILENGVPTYAYDLKQAVKDHYLVSYQSIETKLKLPTDGLHYDDLSAEEQAYFDDQFEDDVPPKDIDGNEFNFRIFNQSTVEIVLQELMEKGFRTASGDDIGKTIIFAKNHAHADYIKEIFHQRCPEKGNDYIKVIDYSVKHYRQLIDEFSIKEQEPQIAVSVDTLDTGIDVPEVANLVFFKKIRSKIKFWQMIGRGTRLCTDLYGPGIDKDLFFIFDYGDNFDYFREDSQTGMGNEVLPLTQRLYNIRVDLIRELRASQFQNAEHQKFREELISQIIHKLQGLNNEDFRVRMNLKTVIAYRNSESWNQLGIIESEEIKNNLTPLILPDDDDELAKRFDVWMHCIELATLVNGSASLHIKQVIVTAKSLQAISNIPQIFAKLSLIKEIQNEEYWSTVTIRKLEKIRTALRDFLQFIDRDSKKIYYTNFEDGILSVVDDQ